MHSSRVAVSWSLAALATLALSAGACSFPDIDFAPATTGGGTTTSTGGTGGTTATGGDTSSGGGIAGAPPTTSSSGGGGTAGSPSGNGGTGGASCCDCDGDGVDAIGPVCNGTDCNDHNEFVYPGEPTYYTTANENGFDWDCTNEPEPYPAWSKAITCGFIGLPCNSAGKGFLGTVPACGQKGNFGECTGTLLPCKEHVIEYDKPMACK